MGETKTVVVDSVSVQPIFLEECEGSRVLTHHLYCGLGFLSDKRRYNLAFLNEGQIHIFLDRDLLEIMEGVTSKKKEGTDWLYHIKFIIESQLLDREVSIVEDSRGVYQLYGIVDSGDIILL